MALQFGPTKIGAMQYNGVTIGEAMYNGHVVYRSGLPVVTITGTSGNVSRDQFRQACIDYGTTYDTVQVLPFLLDTSQATDLNHMFYGCSSLTTVPDMDTSQVTNMGGMFLNCLALTKVPDLVTSQVWGIATMFQNCSSLTDGNVRLYGRNPSVYQYETITGSGLTRIPYVGAEGTIAGRTLTNNSLTTLATHTITAAEGSNLKLLRMTLAWGNATATKSIRIDRNGAQVATATGQNPTATVEVVCNVGDVITYKATVNSTTTANRVINSGTWGAWNR